MQVNTERYNAHSQTPEGSSAELRVSGLASGTHRSVSGYLSPEGISALDAEPSPASMRVALAGDAYGDPAAQGDIQQQVAELIVSMVERGEISAEPTETDDGVPEIHSQPDGSLLVAGVQIRTHQQIIDAWVADLTGQSNALVTIGLGFGMVAVFVAGLVISNTFQVLVASRSRTMALLIGVTLVSTMTMGATTAQHSLSAELAERNPVDARLGTVSAETEQGLQDSPIVVAHQKLPGTVASLQGEKLVAGPDEGRAIFAADSAVEEIARSESLFQDEHGEGPVALISPELLVNGRAETAEITLTPHSPADGAAEAITATAVPASWVPADTVVLLAASVVVAVVGVSNTLALSVFERRREAALLRAMGMTRGSVGAMVTLEALLMAAVALVLGSGLGAFLAWGGVSSLVAHEEVTVVLGVPWGRMARIWGVTLVAAVLASLLPARALSRIPPAAGLSAQ